MTASSTQLPPVPGRRQFLAGAGLAGAAMFAPRAWAQTTADLDLPGGPSSRPITNAFPGKRDMILQRTRPPLLETPMSVFDQGVFTPNDQFFVRWHWANIPTAIDVATFKLTVRGHVGRPLTLSLADLLAMPRQQIAAVNQCSGNSRGLFQPRVSGGQWRHGAMGNAKWVGVSLRHILDLAGVQPGAIAVRFSGLDQPVVDNAPDFAKSLSLDHARDGEVMLAFQMNGEQLPLLNGFPIRLIVPGWYSTYWVKMLNDIARTRPILSPSQPNTTPPLAAPTRNTAMIAPNHFVASFGSALGPSKSFSAGWPMSGKSPISKPSKSQPRNAAASVIVLARFTWGSDIGKMVLR